MRAVPALLQVLSALFTTSVVLDLMASVASSTFMPFCLWNGLVFLKHLRSSFSSIFDAPGKCVWEEIKTYLQNDYDESGQGEKPRWNGSNEKKQEAHYWTQFDGSRDASADQCLIPHAFLYVPLAIMLARQSVIEFTLVN